MLRSRKRAASLALFLVLSLVLAACSAHGGSSLNTWPPISQCSRSLDLRHGICRGASARGVVQKT